MRKGAGAREEAQPAEAEKREAERADLIKSLQNRVNDEAKLSGLDKEQKDAIDKMRNEVTDALSKMGTTQNPLTVVIKDASGMEKTVTVTNPKSIFDPSNRQQWMTDNPSKTEYK